MSSNCLLLREFYQLAFLAEVMGRFKEVYVGLQKRRPAFCANSLGPGGALGILPMCRAKRGSARC